MFSVHDIEAEDVGRARRYAALHKKTQGSKIYGINNEFFIWLNKIEKLLIDIDFVRS